MMRYILTLITSITFLPPAIAMLAPHKELACLDKRVSRAFVQPLPAHAEDRAYRLTQQTEILLNGRKCKYEEVPNTAEIIRMEIDSEESRIILRIHFQTRK